ncbi:hypothetical protein D3C72_1303780 [compost metagenome]
MDNNTAEMLIMALKLARKEDSLILQEMWTIKKKLADQITLRFILIITVLNLVMLLTLIML